MSIDSALHGLILRVHRTGVEGAPWIGVAGEIGERLGAFGVGVIVHRTDQPTVLPASTLTGYRDLRFDEVLAEYAAHYHQRNPQVLFERARPNALTYLDGQDAVFTPDNFPDFSRWERDRMGVRFHAVAYCRPSEHLVYAFLFPGSDHTGPISGERLDLFHLLTCHLRQGVATSQRLGLLGCEAGRTHTPFEQHLETLSQGVAITDGHGRVLFANTALVGMARASDGFTLGSQGLRPTRPNERAALLRSCSSAAGVHEAGLQGGGTVVISRPSCRQSYLVSVDPLVGGWDERHRRAVLLTVTDPEEPARASELLLRDAFGLTTTEARVSARLFADGNLERVAVAMDVTVGTLRSHLKSIFGKTRTGSQVELMTFLARLPRRAP